MFPFRVLQISERSVLSEDELLARVRRGGPQFAVLVRDPELSARAQLEQGRRLRQATQRVGGGLLVADRIDLALVLDADGVHLGRASVSLEDARFLLKERIVTRSVHELIEVEQQLAAWPDAVLMSPIFASPGKGVPLGLAALRRARDCLPPAVRLVALGGVTRVNAAACFDAGADAVASIRADLSGVCDGFLRRA